MLDSTLDIDTPEGVVLELPVAGLAPRALAWLVDATLKLVLLVLLSALLGWMGTTGFGLFLIVLFVVFWGYNTAFELFNHGATPGKRLLGLRVVHANGTPVGAAATIIRNLVRAVDVLPGTYLFGAVSVLMTHQFQRLGDLAAGTVVVYAAKPLRLPVRRDLASKRPPVALDAQAQAALITFSERAPQLTEARRQELVAVLEPVLKTRSSQDIEAYANWLAGHRESQADAPG